MKRALIALALAVLCAASPARAVLLDLAASDLGGNTLDFEVLDGGVLAVDPHFATATPMRIVLVPEPGDPAELVWNALVDNLTGELWGAFAIEADFATIGVGSAVANATDVFSIDPIPGGVRLLFQLPGEPAGFDLGAVFGTGTDWTLTPFSPYPIELRLIPVPVPEPTALALLGMGLAGLARRRSA